MLPPLLPLPFLLLRPFQIMFGFALGWAARGQQEERRIRDGV